MATPGYFDNPSRLARLKAECESWQGTRFAQGMASKGMGVDCVHFVIGVLAACGIPTEQLGTVPKYSMLEGRHTTNTQLLAWLKDSPLAKEHLRPVDELRPGDIAACRARLGVSHLGIAASNRAVWHADRQMGVCCMPVMQFKQVSAWRILDNINAG